MSRPGWSYVFVMAVVEKVIVVATVIGSGICYVAKKWL